MTEPDQIEAKILDDVERVGWSVMGVFDPDDHRPAYAYTIGLQKWGWPEVLCVGLDPSHAGPVLNNAVAELRDRRVDPVPGMTLSAVLSGYCCRLAAAPGAGDMVPFARWFARHDGGDPDVVGVIQLHWPNKAGSFPTDPQCDTATIQQQALRD